MTMNDCLYFLNEIKDIITSENFLSGYDGIHDIEIPINGKLYHRKISTIEQYFFCTSIKNNDTFFTKLIEDIIEQIAAAEMFLHNFTKRQVNYDVLRTTSTESPQNRKKIEDLLDYITQDRKIECNDKNERSNLYHHLCRTISGNIDIIIRARILTLSKRIIPTELMLDAYRLGLYPFGWSYEDYTLYCLNPFH
jgi:hypothetical protein